MFKKVERCRICGNTELSKVIDLGKQMLTGVFPKDKALSITSGPLELVKCIGTVDKVCGLVQLSGTYNLNEMYGINYGYRSGLNASMVEHLHNKVERVLRLVPLSDGDIIIDIGSNDCTTLKAYPKNRFNLVGIDPTGKKFKEYYPSEVKLIADFFSADLFRKSFGQKRAKVVTSFSMFYDLDEPMRFMKEIHEIIDDDGIWVFEQSYISAMLSTNSYDTICHEHLEYYALEQIKWMADRVGFKIVDFEFNEINGGSFSITAAKKGSKFQESLELRAALQQENNLKLNDLNNFKLFASRIQKTKSDLLNFLKQARQEGKKVFGLGASTKGNVLLQYCNITTEDLPYIGEVNPEKFGCFTPGTYIPIISEAELLKMKPDYLLVLPWHFKPFFLKQEKFKKIKLVFPLPELEII